MLVKRIAETESWISRPTNGLPTRVDLAVAIVQMLPTTLPRTGNRPLFTDIALFVCLFIIYLFPQNRAKITLVAMWILQAYLLKSI